MPFREEDDLVLVTPAILRSRFESEDWEDLVVMIMIALLRKMELCASSHRVLWGDGMGYQLLSKSSNFDRVGMLAPILRARLLFDLLPWLFASAAQGDVRQWGSSGSSIHCSLALLHAYSIKVPPEWKSGLQHGTSLKEVWCIKHQL